MKNKEIAKVLTIATIVGNINMAFAENVDNINGNNTLTTTISQQSSTVIKTGITTASLNVRKGPSTSYGVIGGLSKGAKVEIVEVSTTGWYKIKFKNEYGYVSNKYVEVDKKDESSEQKPPTVIKTGTTTAGLNVRKGPSTSYGVIGVLSKDTKVEIVEVSITGWYKIKFKNEYGYVSNKYVEVGKKDESSEQKPPTVIKIGITTAGLNVRKGPSTSYGVIGGLSKGAKVEIVEVSTTGWYKIKFKNEYGYVSNQYVADKNSGEGTVEGDRVYQNPSNYFQIQENISFKGQGNYILKTGTMGLKVRKVQEKLGMSRTNKAIVGPATTAKIKEFQKSMGLSQTGQVDYTTWNALGLSDDDWHNLGSYVSPIQITKNSTKNDCIETMISRAYDYLGTEYIVGASGQPGQGVDCSGLVMQALYSVGINPLPVSVIRHSQPGYEYESRNLFTSSKFKTVSYEDRQRGDLIFYSDQNGTIIHIAIYLGNDQVIEAWPGKVVVWPIKNSHRDRIAGVRRVFN